MGWFWWLVAIGLAVFAMRDLWAAYEALAHEPRRPGRAAVELVFFGVSVLLILWIFGVVP